MTRCTSALVATAILALAGMPTVPDNTDGSAATCSSQIVAGIEVDNCVAGPDAPARNQQIVHKILAKWALRPPTNRPIVP